MPFDIVAFYESQAAAALTLVAGVADRYYRVSGDDIFVKKRAPYLAGLLFASVTQATMKYAELRQPSLKVPYRTYQAGDVNDAALPQAFLNLLGSPLPLYAGEKLNAYALNATNEVDMIVAWLSSGKVSLAQLEAVMPTHIITGYADAALTAGSWTDVDITWDQSLEKGKYAVVGMKVGSYHATTYAGGVARLLLTGEQAGAWVPGVIVRQCEDDKLALTGEGSKLLSGERWPLMQEISFEHDDLPNLQMLCANANTDHVVELLLQKIG